MSSLYFSEVVRKKKYIILMLFLFNVFESCKKYLLENSPCMLGFGWQLILTALVHTVP